MTAGFRRAVRRSANSTAMSGAQPPRDALAAHVHDARDISRVAFWTETSCRADGASPPANFMSRNKRRLLRARCARRYSALSSVILLHRVR